MAAYGLISPRPHQPHAHTIIRLAGPDDVHPLSRPHKIDWSASPLDNLDITGLSPDEIHHKIQEMMHGLEEGGVVPFMRGGEVRIMSNVQEPGSREGSGEVAHPGGGLHGHAGWHHRRPNSFSGR